jgi:hypothetical protein
MEVRILSKFACKKLKERRVKKGGKSVEVTEMNY